MSGGRIQYDMVPQFQDGNYASFHTVPLAAAAAETHPWPEAANESFLFTLNAAQVRCTRFATLFSSVVCGWFFY